MCFCGWFPWISCSQYIQNVCFNSRNIFSIFSFLKQYVSLLLVNMLFIVPSLFTIYFSTSCCCCPTSQSLTLWLAGCRSWYSWSHTHHRAPCLQGMCVLPGTVWTPCGTGPSSDKPSKHRYISLHTHTHTHTNIFQQWETFHRENWENLVADCCAYPNLFAEKAFKLRTLWNFSLPKFPTLSLCAHLSRCHHLPVDWGGVYRLWWQWNSAALFRKVPANKLSAVAIPSH